MSFQAGWRHVKAKDLRGAEADRLFERAIRTYDAVLALQPDWYPVRQDRGVAYLDQAKRKTGQDGAALLAQACADILAALDRHSGRRRRSIALNNLGLTYSRQARLTATSPEDADRLFQQAGERFAESVQLRPRQAETISNWGVTLWQQAKRKPPSPEADALFAEAYRKFALCPTLKPRHTGALQNWGGALMCQARQKSGEDAERLFAASREKLFQGEALRPGSNSYNMACLCAIRGEAEARQWLEKGLATGDLYHRPDLLTELDFASLREWKWFQDLAAAQAAGPARCCTV